ncbi:MAG: DUF1573 domain-containing protein, partial [Planctomycetota bacterium]|nr:DUF1573 domain-containing protein [Planctomycetota bacterium]
KTTTRQAAKPADGSPPSLTLEKQFVDAGVLKHKSTREEIVNIRNTGGSDLVIRKTILACKCGKVSFDRKRLKPGESARMTVKILTRDYWGEVSEKIGIISNDPTGPKLLTIRFEVLRDLVAVPDRLHLGFAAPGQAMRKQVKVVANTDVDTKALYAISNNPEALVGRVIKPILKKDTPAVLEVEFKAPSKPGTYRNSLSITTGHSAQSTVRLPVTLCVSRTISVKPDRLDFGRLVKGENVKRSLNVKAGAGTELKSVVARPEVLDVKVGPADTEGSIAVDLTVIKEVRYGKLAGEIRLEFIGEEQSTLTVPFAGYIIEEAAPQ